MKVWELIKALEQVTDKYKEVRLDEYTAKTVIEANDMVQILSKEPEEIKQLFP